MNSVAETGPLAFRILRGKRHLPGPGIDAAREVFKVEARHVGGHVREAIVTEGDGGSAWRMLSDEGLHLKGTDLAPFPFGYFNAGLQADLMRCIRNAASVLGVVIDSLEITLDNEYWLTGSFVRGTAQGFAEPTRIEIRLGSGAATGAIAAVINAALAASPALALLRSPLKNTFALYINGRRRKVAGVAPSLTSDVPDPFVCYKVAPQPPAHDGDIALIEKTAAREAGAVSVAPSATTTRITRKVTGRGRFVGATGMTEIESWLQLPGMSHFIFRSDESVAGLAPCGLALLSAGLAFCYMTQLARYVENMKLAIGPIRLVQFNPYAQGVAEAVDTHLFLNGEAPEEVQTNLLSIAARTCYLHATLAATLPPQVRVILNGQPLD